MKALGASCLFIAGLAACGGPLNPEDIPDIDGAWIVTESNDGNGSSCLSIGTLDIAQKGEQFSAQFSRTSQCSSGSIPGSSAAQSGSVVAGRVGRETVDFRIGDCDYRGVIVSEGRPNQITGSILCTTIMGTGHLSTAAGTWHADRLND